MHVNVAPSQVIAAGFVAIVGELVTRHRLRPGQLALEITESGIFADLDAARPAVTQLRSLGVGVSLDDFGVGYSSLAQLNSMPLDSVRSIGRSWPPSTPTPGRPPSCAPCSGWPRTSACRSSPMASSAPASSTSCGRWAARSPRGTCSAARSRATPSPRCSSCARSSSESHPHGWEPVKAPDRDVDLPGVTDLFEPTRRADCRPLLADPDDLTVVWAPVVDLTTAEVTGWRAEGRFPGTATPDVWFAAAADAGLAAPLQALLLQTALARRPDAGQLHVPVDPWLLGAPLVHEALQGPLADVVLELTDSPVDDEATLVQRCTRLVGRGARLAVPAALLMRVPQLPADVVVLPHGLTAGLAGDPRRSALAAGLLTYAERLGATVLADGVETTAELSGLTSLGVPLARGWLLGPPTDGFGPAGPEVVRLLRGRGVQQRRDSTVVGLLRPVRTWTPGRDDRQLTPPVVQLAPTGEPAELTLVDARTGDWFDVPATLVLTTGTAITEALHRALARRPAHRFDPVPCTDASGTVVGLARVEDLAEAAAAG